MTSQQQLCARSADATLKRARILYAPQFVENSTSAESIRQSALARRKRLRFGTATDDASSTSTTALVVSSSNSNSKNTSQQQASSSVLTAVVQDSDSKNQTHDSETRILTKSSQINNTHIPTPTWHAPWKLHTVISSHLGWVRSLALEPVHNRLLATGSVDRTIKVWNFPKAAAGRDEGSLLYTLTGHISAVRALVFSNRHPYLFSAAEDKQVKCWDLETNQVVRHYHGHLSGVYAAALHPTVDVLVTGGRDAVARVWDVRSKNQVHVLTGHDNTVTGVLCQSTEPQVITSSQDSTVKLWDLVAGKCRSTLTHHSQGIRALVQPTFQRSFVSGGADCLKKWQGVDGRYLQSYDTGSVPNQNRVINALAVNDDGVLVSGSDDGVLQMWDYESGYSFQQWDTQVQPGSLESENGILALAFDGTGTRLITGEADKSIKIYKQDEEASELSHPVDMVGWRKKCIAQRKARY